MRRTGQFIIVLKKELKDLFRDKKTFIVGVLIPLLLMPVLFTIMGFVMSKSIKDTESNLKIIVKDMGTSSLGKFIESNPSIKLVEGEDIKETVKEGKAYVGIEIPVDFDSKIENEEQISLKLYIDNSSQQSQTARSIVESLINSYSNEIVKNRLEKRNIDVNILDPLVLEDINAGDTNGNGFSTYMISLMLPMFLIMYGAISPIASATDLGAGEKERGTLEPLLSTKANRLSMLWGKVFAVSIMGIIGSVASIIGLGVSFLLPFSILSISEGTVSEISIGLNAIIIMLVFSVFTSMIFGALELAVSIYARSFKEASTYLSPISIMAIVPVYVTMGIDPKNISPIMFHVPIANMVCVIKQMLIGIYDYKAIGITILWAIIYLLLSMFAARYMFSREEVIFRT